MKSMRALIELYFINDLANGGILQVFVQSSILEVVLFYAEMGALGICKYQWNEYIIIK